MRHFSIGDYVCVTEDTGKYFPVQKGFTGVVREIHKNGYVGVMGDGGEYIVISGWFLAKAKDPHSSASFGKKDLENGDVVVLRNGSVKVFFKLFSSDEGAFYSLTDSLSYGMSPSNFTEDLRDADSESVYDVMKAYRPARADQCSAQYYKEGTLLFDRDGKDRKALDRIAWISEWYGKCVRDKSVGSIHMGDLDSGEQEFTMVYCLAHPQKNAFSYCSPEDEYDCVTGTAIAYARYSGEAIPKEI